MAWHSERLLAGGSETDSSMAMRYAGVCLSTAILSSAVVCGALGQHVLRLVRCDGIVVAVAMDELRCVRPGGDATFRDCPECPEMMILPAGEFAMGSIEHGDEQPVHTVTISQPFAVGRFEVTFAEWDACVD